MESNSGDATVHNVYYGIIGRWLDSAHVCALPIELPDMWVRATRSSAKAKPDFVGDPVVRRRTDAEPQRRPTRSTSALVSGVPCITSQRRFPEAAVCLDADHAGSRACRNMSSATAHVLADRLRSWTSQAMMPCS